MTTTLQAVPQQAATGDTLLPRRWSSWFRSAVGVVPFLGLIALTFVFAQTDPDYW